MSDNTDDPCEIEPLTENLGDRLKNESKSAGKKNLEKGLDLRKIIFETTVIFEIIYGSILYIFLAVIMGISSFSSDYYPMNCKIQLYWAEKAYVFYSIRAIFTLLFLSTYCFKKFQGNVQIVLNWMITLLRLMFITISLIIFAQMINAFVKIEDCGVLEKWSLIYIIVDSVNIGFTMLFLCCFGGFYVIHIKENEKIV